jgi:glucan phosphoethanolaminetransferase (alkaline phosphatase superfamily)
MNFGGKHFSVTEIIPYSLLLIFHLALTILAVVMFFEKMHDDISGKKSFEEEIETNTQAITTNLFLAVVYLLLLAILFIVKKEDGAPIIQTKNMNTVFSFLIYIGILGAGIHFTRKKNEKLQRELGDQKSSLLSTFKATSL